MYRYRSGFRSEAQESTFGYWICVSRFCRILYLFQRLLEQVPGPLQLLPPVPPHKLGEVRSPYVLHVGVLEDVDATLVHLESILKVLVLLRGGGREGRVGVVGGGGCGMWGWRGMGLWRLGLQVYCSVAEYVLWVDEGCTDTKL